MRFCSFKFKITSKLLLVSSYHLLILTQTMSAVSAESIEILLPAKIERDGLTTGAVMRDSEMLNYCINIHDIAKEARSSVLNEKLKAIGTDVDSKLNELEKKIEKLKFWTKKREDFLDNTNSALVKIFETMKPDAAASQFTEIGPKITAAIILKLNPKISSAILTEMDPTDAAKIAIILNNALEEDDVATQ